MCECSSVRHRLDVAGSPHQSNATSNVWYMMCELIALRFARACKMSVLPSSNDVARIERAKNMARVYCVCLCEFFSRSTVPRSKQTRTICYTYVRTVSTYLLFTNVLGECLHFSRMHNILRTVFCLFANTMDTNCNSDI